MRVMVGLLIAVGLVVGPDRPPPGAAVAPAPLAGRLLVAEPKLADPRFVHTVILMIDHGPAGALGVVVNRPVHQISIDRLARLLGQPADDRPPADGADAVQLSYGGPVEPNRLTIVHSADYRGPATRAITDRIAVTADPALVADLAHGRGPAHLLVTLGYAGWAPGQLEGELARGDWFVLPGYPDLVFADDAGRVWRDALARRPIDL